MASWTQRNETHQDLVVSYIVVIPNFMTLDWVFESLIETSIITYLTFVISRLV
ncbi:MAG: hypothetical protein P8J32_00205 [bacterium]|nr:hypothetical protein [bacterium]